MQWIHVVPTPSTYFKLGKLEQYDEEKKEIIIRADSNLPIANTGDGVAVNIKASRILREVYGLVSPDFRCAAHIGW